VADYLERGKIIAYPTETVYGLGCDALNKRAITRLNKMKGRDAGKQLIILVDSMTMAKKYVKFTSEIANIAKTYWPGPLSFILPTTELGRQVFKTNTLAVRISSNEIATAIVKKIKRPLVSTSANLSGSQPARSGLEAAAIFIGEQDEPDLILDAGKLKISKGSTILDCTLAEISIVRQGDVKFKI